MATPNGLLDMFEYMDSVLNSYVTAVSANFIGSISPIIAAGIGIHYTLIAYAAMRGQETDPIQKIFKEAFTTIFIIALALTAGNYQGIIVNGVAGLTNFITGNITTSSPGSTPSPSLFHAVSMLWGGDIVDYGGKKVPAMTALWEIAKKNPIYYIFPNPDYIVGGLLMMVANVVICLFCIIPYFISKIYIAILLAIGPLFIMGAIWPATRNYFSAWLANLIGNVLTICIVTVVSTFATTAYTNALVKSTQNANDLSSFQPMMVGGATLIIAFFLAMIASQASQQGAQLAGGGMAMDSKGAAGMAIQTFMNSKVMGGGQGGGAKGGAEAGNSMSKAGIGSMVAKGAGVGLVAAAGGITGMAAMATYKGLSRITKGLNKRN